MHLKCSLHQLPPKDEELPHDRDFHEQTIKDAGNGKQLLDGLTEIMKHCLHKDET